MSAKPDRWSDTFVNDQSVPIIKAHIVTNSKANVFSEAYNSGASPADIKVKPVLQVGPPTGLPGNSYSAGFVTHTVPAKSSLRLEFTEIDAAGTTLNSTWDLFAT